MTNDLTIVNKMSAATVMCQILFLALFLQICYVFGEKYKQIPIEIKENPGGEPLKIFTATELAKYDASDPDLPIYMALRGVVFDVTSGKCKSEPFYSKDSSYNILTGKDASRGHALWSLDKKDLTYDLTGLTDEQLMGLDEIFQGTYMAKYPVVGYMDHFISDQSDDIKNRFTNDEL